MPFSQFEKDLKKIGLNDKEAAVYLSALTLGPSPVQQIARKAKVARATTYLVLEALIKLGLVTRLEESGKTFFIAEDPTQLERLLDARAEEIRTQRHELAETLPKLRAYMKGIDDKPVVRYYEGIEGLKSMRQEMVMQTEAGDTWYNITPIDRLGELFGKDEIDPKPRVKKGFLMKTIFTTKDDELKREFLLHNTPRATRRYITPKHYKGKGGVTIYRDRIAIGSFYGRLGGIIIESAAIADLMKEMFERVWETLENTVDKR